MTIHNNNELEIVKQQMIDDLKAEYIEVPLMPNFEKAVSAMMDLYSRQLVRSRLKEYQDAQDKR